MQYLVNSQHYSLGSQQQGGSEQPTTVLGEFNLKFGETWPTFGKQQLNLSRKLTGKIKHF